MSTDAMQRLGDLLMPKPFAPTPGLHRDIPEAEYHRLWNAASNSRLSLLRRSPAHLKASIDHPAEPTPALILGSAIHSAVLEPDTFRSRYARAPEGDGRTAKVKEALAALQITHRPECILTAAQYDCALAVRDSILVHSRARDLFDGDGQTELTAAWNDAETGVLCKARLDRHTSVSARGAIVDLKSTRDASEAEFARAMWKYGYHRQGAHYLGGATANQLDAAHFVNVVVEKEPPYAVAVYRLTEGTIDAGRDQLAVLLKRYAKCLADGEWPAYPDVKDISLPDFAWKLVELESMEAA